MLGLLGAITNQDILAQAAPINFIRTTDGLIFKDDFNRPDNADVGNGWEETGSFSISEFQLAHAGTSDDRTRRNLPAPNTNDILIQIVVNSGGTSGNVVSIEVGQNSAANRAFAFAQNFVNANLSLFDAGLKTIASFTDGVTTPAAYRITVSSSLDSVQYLRGYRADSVNTGSFPTSAMTLKQEGYASESKEMSGSYFGTFCSRNPAEEDNFLLCGREIRVDNMLAGEKIQLIGPEVTHSVVEATGTTVRIDVGAYALPITRIELLSATDEVLAAYQSSSGEPDIWGGDIFSARDN